jgi:transcriptional regulator with XRE-family HTH domain
METMYCGTGAPVNGKAVAAEDYDAHGCGSVRGRAGEVMNEDELRLALVDLRARLGLKQEDLARRLQVSQDWVSRHEADPERPRHASITIADAHKWADAMGYGLIVALVPPSETGAGMSSEARDTVAELAAVASRLDRRSLRLIRGMIRDAAQAD